MFILHHLLNAIVEIVDLVLEAYAIIVVIYALLSWVNPDPQNPIVRFIAAVTEPVLAPFRRLISPYKTGGIDVSPIFVILIIVFLRHFIVPVLFDLAAKAQ